MKKKMSVFHISYIYMVEDILNFGSDRFYKIGKQMSRRNIDYFTKTIKRDQGLDVTVISWQRFGK